MESGQVEPRSCWQGCYDDSWRGLIVDEAFAHPAKFALGLVRRICEHGLAVGWWRKGDLIGDPFAGIGCGGIVAAENGLRWIGIELEPKFVAFAERNFELNGRRWRNLGDPEPVIVQGDSRGFAALVAEGTKARRHEGTELDAVVTSPPFLDARADTTASRKGKTAPTVHDPEAMGNGAGQIGRLPPGDLDAVVTSPPYADSQGSPSLGSVNKDDWGNQGGDIVKRRGLTAEYGESTGQIGRLPAGESLDAVVTSPPYEAGLGKENTYADQAKRQGYHKRSIRTRKGIADPHYGNAPGQIGQNVGETYWQAVATVYGQCRQVLKPGGVLVVVVKDYVKAGKRVPLCDQTLMLLQRLGLEAVERIRAMLVKEQREAALFGGPIVRRTERKSFFRRLAEKKGSPHIDWEEVIVVRKATPQLATLHCEL